MNGDIELILSEIDKLHIAVASCTDERKARRMVEEISFKIIEGKAERLIIETGSSEYQLLKYKGESPGIKSGYDELDRYCYFPRGAITMISALTHHGKSCFMRNLAHNMMQTMGGDIVYFAYEDLHDDFWRDFDCIAYSKLVDGKKIPVALDIHSYDKQRKIKGGPVAVRDDIIQKSFAERIHVQDQQFSTRWIRIILRELIRRYPRIRVVFFDYLQLLPYDNEEGNIARYREISAIMSDLLSIAKEFGVSIINACQLNQDNRNPSRKNIESMFNVYEAKAINHFASLWLSVWNETEFMMQTGEIKDEPDTHNLKISIFKNRTLERKKKRDIPLYLSKMTGEIFQSKTSEVNNDEA